MQRKKRKKNTGVNLTVSFTLNMQKNKQEIMF